MRPPGGGGTRGGRGGAGDVRVSGMGVLSTQMPAAASGGATLVPVLLTGPVGTQDVGEPANERVLVVNGIRAAVTLAAVDPSTRLIGVATDAPGPLSDADPRPDADLLSDAPAVGSTKRRSDAAGAVDATLAIATPESPSDAHNTNDTGNTDTAHNTDTAGNTDISDTANTADSGRDAAQGAGVTDAGVATVASGPVTDALSANDSSGTANAAPGSASGGLASPMASELGEQRAGTGGAVAARVAASGDRSAVPGRAEVSGTTREPRRIETRTIYIDAKLLAGSPPACWDALDDLYLSAGPSDERAAVFLAHGVSLHARTRPAGSRLPWVPEQGLARSATDPQRSGKRSGQAQSPTQVRDVSVRDAQAPDVSTRDVSARDASARGVSEFDGSVRDASVRGVSARDGQARGASVRDVSVRDVSVRDVSARASETGVANKAGMANDPRETNATREAREALEAGEAGQATGWVLAARVVGPRGAGVAAEMALGPTRAWRPGVSPAVRGRIVLATGVAVAGVLAVALLTDPRRRTPRGHRSAAESSHSSTTRDAAGSQAAVPPAVVSVASDPGNAARPRVASAGPTTITPGPLEAGARVSGPAGGPWSIINARSSDPADGPGEMQFRAEASRTAWNDSTKLEPGEMRFRAEASRTQNTRPHSPRAWLAGVGFTLAAAAAACAGLVLYPALRPGVERIEGAVVIARIRPIDTVTPAAVAADGVADAALDQAPGGTLLQVDRWIYLARPGGGAVAVGGGDAVYPLILPGGPRRAFTAGEVADAGNGDGGDGDNGNGDTGDVDTGDVDTGEGDQTSRGAGGAGGPNATLRGGGGGFGDSSSGDGGAGDGPSIPLMTWDADGLAWRIQATLAPTDRLALLTRWVVAVESEGELTLSPASAVLSSLVRQNYPPGATRQADGNVRLTVR